MQSLRHDLKNKHLTLLALLEENPDEAREYLHSLTDSISGKQTFTPKNPTINFLLNQKLHDVEDEIALFKFTALSLKNYLFSLIF